MRTRATGVSGPGAGASLIRDQELGRLPWLAPLFFRAFFLRAFFAMLCLLVLVTVRPRASAAEVAYRFPDAGNRRR